MRLRKHMVQEKGGGGRGRGLLGISIGGHGVSRGRHGIVGRKHA